MEATTDDKWIAIGFYVRSLLVPPPIMGGSRVLMCTLLIWAQWFPFDMELLVTPLVSKEKDEVTGEHIPISVRAGGNWSTNKKFWLETMNLVDVGPTRQSQFKNNPWQRVIMPGGHVKWHFPGMLSSADFNVTAHRLDYSNLDQETAAAVLGPMLLAFTQANRSETNKQDLSLVNIEKAVNCLSVFSFEHMQCEQFKPGKLCLGQLWATELESLLVSEKAGGSCKPWFALLDGALRYAFSAIMGIFNPRVFMEDTESCNVEEDYECTNSKGDICTYCTDYIDKEKTICRQVNRCWGEWDFRKKSTTCRVPDSKVVKGCDGRSLVDIENKKAYQPYFWKTSCMSASLKSKNPEDFLVLDDTDRPKMEKLWQQKLPGSCVNFQQDSFDDLVKPWCRVGATCPSPSKA